MKFNSLKNANNSELKYELDLILKKQKECMHVEEEIQGRRIFKVIKSMIVSNGLTILIQLLMVPILIYFLGIGLYGEWLILYAIPSYILLSDFGIITTANTRIDILCEKGKYFSANKVYYNSNIVLISLFLFLFLFISLVWLVFGGYIKEVFSILNSNEIVLFSLFLMLDSFICLIYNHNSALYRTLKKFNITVNWQAICRTIPILFFLLSISIGSDLLSSILIMFLCRIVILFAMYADLKKKIFWLDRKYFFFSRQIYFSILKLAKNYMLIPVSNIIYLQGTILTIAFLFNPTIVAIYSTMRTYTRLMPQFIGIVGRSRWSEISYLFSNQKNNEIKVMGNKVLVQTLMLSIFISIGYFFIGDTFYIYWVGGDFDFDKQLYFFLILNSLAITWYYSFEVFLLAANKMAIYPFIFFILSIFQIILGWLFSGYFGVSAFPIMSTFCSFLIFLTIIFLFYKKKDLL